MEQHDKLFHALVGKNASCGTTLIVPFSYRLPDEPHRFLVDHTSLKRLHEVIDQCIGSPVERPRFRVEMCTSDGEHHIAKEHCVSKCKNRIDRITVRAFSTPTIFKFSRDDP